jgi:curved DNA-binding protein CbpA
MNTNDNAEIIDYYELLGIPLSSTLSDIHKAYWRKALHCHPDKGGNHEEMLQLVEAWNILSDPSKRARYDQLYKYRHDSWRNRKFNDDVLDARKHAESSLANSWEEFEVIYQKAFYTFNQDFYGEDLEKTAAGPYSPLMKTRKADFDRSILTKHEADASNFTKTWTIFINIVMCLILFAIILSGLYIYRNFIHIGGYKL